MSVDLDSRGNTPLLRACRHKDAAEALSLLAGGADVFSQNKDGDTALHLASDAALEQVVVALLNAGADPCVSNRFGVTPLHVARTPKICASLYLAGASLGALDVSKRSALHWASRRGLSEVMQALVAMGAGANSYDQHGNTPLHLASNAKAVDAAREAGAIENVRNARGLTPVQLAAQRGQKHLHNGALLSAAGVLMPRMG